MPTTHGEAARTRADRPLPLSPLPAGPGARPKALELLDVAPETLRLLGRGTQLPRPGGGHRTGSPARAAADRRTGRAGPALHGAA